MKILYATGYCLDGMFVASVFGFTVGYAVASFAIWAYRLLI